MHPYHHALSSAKKFGGKPEDYIEIHSWFDASKEYFANFRHRALRHHAQGIYECERKFGVTMTNSDGRTLPVRYIGEQHVMEDLGRIPSLEDWLSLIMPQDWMHKKPQHAAKDIVEEAINRRPEATTMIKTEKISL
jgi:hypothetical protein